MRRVSQIYSYLVYNKDQVIIDKFVKFAGYWKFANNHEFVTSLFAPATILAKHFVTDFYEIYNSKESSIQSCGLGESLNKTVSVSGGSWRLN